MRRSVRARHVVGYRDGDHCLLRDAEVVWEDDTVVYVGPRYEGVVDDHLDCGDAVVSPGFVDLNALGDIDHAVFDSFQDDELLKGQDWSTAYARDGRRELFSREELAFRREYALVQLLLHGVTTAVPIAAETYRAWAETYEELVDVAETAGRLGIRAYLGPSYRAGVPVVDARGERSTHWDHDEARAGLDAAERFVRDVDGAFDGRVRGMLAPARIESQTLETLAATARLRDELDCPVRLHAAQSLEELDLLRRRHGARPVPLLKELRLLGPTTIVPHAWAVDDHTQVGDGNGDDLRDLAESRTTVAFCPLASGRYGMVLESFDRYLRSGVSLGLGTDTFPPDMLRAIDHGSAISKTVERRQDAGRVEDLFRAATLGGAQALRRPDLGRLAPGAKADLVVVALDDLRTGPVADPLRTLVLAGSGRDVTHVVVDGRFVVRDGTVPGVDVRALRERAQALLDRYQHSFTERDHLHRPTGILMPPTFRTA